MIINTAPPDQPDVRAMLARLDAYHAALSPAESNHLPGVDPLLRDVDGSAVGCAVLVNRSAADEHDGDPLSVFMEKWL